MTDGRHKSESQVIPIATDVTDAKYCFKDMRDLVDSDKELLLLSAGRERCLPTYRVARTEFTCILVEFVVEGRGKLQIQKEIHELFPGKIFCYGMNTPHDLWVEPTDPMTKYFVAFRSGRTYYQHRIAPVLGIQPGDIRWTRDLSALRILFEELIREGQRHGKLHEEIAACYLNLILLKGAEAVESHRDHLRDGGKESYERALAFIEEQFANIESLDELGAQLGLQANQLCRLFRRFGNETPNQCISRYRLNRAAELLLTHSDSIADIARTVGYDDPYYFSRVFRRRFGSSPTEFRKKAM